MPDFDVNVKLDCELEMQMSIHATPAPLNGMPVDDLRAELLAHGESNVGDKGELKHRLQDARNAARKDQEKPFGLPKTPVVARAPSVARAQANLDTTRLAAEAATVVEAARPSLKGLALSLPDDWAGFLGVSDYPGWRVERSGEYYPIVPGTMHDFNYDTHIGVFTVHCGDLGISATNEESGHDDGNDMQLSIRLDAILKFLVRGKTEDGRIKLLEALAARTNASGDRGADRTAPYDILYDKLVSTEVAAGGTLKLIVFDGYNGTDGMHGRNWPKDVCDWAASKNAFGFAEGVVQGNTFVRSFQSGTECGQIGTMAAILAEKDPSGVFNADLSKWEGQQNYKAMVQALNIIRLSDTRIKMLRLMRDFGPQQAERTYGDLSLDTLNTLSCTLDLQQNSVAVHDGVSHQALIKSIRASSGDVLLQIDTDELQDFALRALLWCYGCAET